VEDPHSIPRLADGAALLQRAQQALLMKHVQLGEMLGCSPRTLNRWRAGGLGPSRKQWQLLARRIHPVNRALAEEIARAIGEEIEAIVPATPPARAVASPPEPQRPQQTSVLVDSILCAAAEAAVMTPQATRAALLAAFDRAALLAVPLAELHRALKSVKA
jgi:hypothetical protein